MKNEKSEPTGLSGVCAESVSNVALTKQKIQ